MRGSCRSGGGRSCTSLGNSCISGGGCTSLGGSCRFGGYTSSRSSCRSGGVALVRVAFADLGVKVLALVHGQCTDTQRELQALGSRNCFLYFVLEWGALQTPYPLLLSFYVYRLLLEKGLHRSLHMKPGKVCLMTHVNRRLQLQTLGRCLAFGVNGERNSQNKRVIPSIL